MCSAAPSHDCWLSNFSSWRLNLCRHLCRATWGEVAFISQPSKNDLLSTSCGTFIGWEDFKPFPAQDRKPLAAANFHHPSSRQLRHPFLWPEPMQVVRSHTHHSIQKSQRFKHYPVTPGCSSGLQGGTDPLATSFHSSSLTDQRVTPLFVSQHLGRWHDISQTFLSSVFKMCKVMLTSAFAAVTASPLHVTARVTNQELNRDS